MLKTWLYLVGVFCFGTFAVSCAENLVHNPGFEEKTGTNGLPGNGWWLFEGRGTTEARVDRTIAHTGKSSAQLKAQSDAKCVLVSPKFEVAPGDELHFEAWVRGANLSTTNVGTSAGFAFRHRDGRILDRAYFHVESVTEDWSLISGTARAPAEASAAEVHLGYTNSPGTLWYDDVVATITNPISFALTESAKTWPGAQDITVRIVNRGSSEFHGTVSCSIGKQTSNVPATIAPHQSRGLKVAIVLNGVGTHRYKLSLLDTSGTAIHTMDGNFPTTAPLALFPPCPSYHSVGDGDGTTRIDAKVNLNPAQRTGLKLKVEVFDASGKSIQTAAADAAKGEFVGLTLKLPVAQSAAFTIKAQLVDSTGKSLAEDKTEAHVTKDFARVTLGSDGFLRINDKPNFPIGIYNCGHFEEMGQAGFNATHEYGVVTGEAEDAINPNERHVEELLDKSWANGMRAMIELPRKAIEKAQWQQVRRRIETFRHHPGLLCWGSEERVARGAAPLANIAALYKIIHELDPDHPLVLGDTRDVIQNLQVDRRNFFPDPDMDIGIWWWYPIPLKEPDGNGLEGGANSGMLMEPPSWLTTTLSKKPLWIAIQSYQKPSKDARFPTPDEYRCQSYLSIISGVKGLWFYVGSGQKDFQGKPAGLFNKPEEAHWDYVKKLATELKEFSPVIMALRASGKVTMLPTNATVEFTTREMDEKLYLIAANKSASAQGAKFSSAQFQGCAARVLYENHAVQFEGDTLTDEFQPFGVHVYELIKTR